LYKIEKVVAVPSLHKLMLNEIEGTDLVRIVDTSDPDTLKVIDSITGATQGITDMAFNAIPNPPDQFTMDGVITENRGIHYGVFDGTANLWFGFTLDITTPAKVDGFALSSQYIYVAMEERGLAIYSRANGSLVGACDLPGVAEKIKVVGNYAYLACKQEGLQIVDISNPAAPVKVGSYDTVGYATHVDVWNDYAVVASGGGGLYLFNISSPNRPELIDNLTDCGYTNTARFYNGKVIVGSRDLGILVYKIK